MVDFLQLTHPFIHTLAPYIPGKAINELKRELGLEEIIKLASNENPFGASPKAIAAGREAIGELEFYPDGGYDLKQALSELYQIKSEQITLGNGSENLIAMLIQAFCNDNEEIIMSEYGFGMYSIIARGHHVQPIVVPAKGWGHDLAAMAKAVTTNTKLLFIASPNNPTGTSIKHQDLANLLQHVPDNVIVVVDEAYYEYCCDDEHYPKSLTLQQQHDNLVILRTFSKAYGLAGLRLGYAISSNTISDILNRIRLPFNVSAVAEKVGLAALADQAHVRQAIAHNQQAKQQLYQAYEALELDYIESAANFICVKFGEKSQEIYQSLLKNGVIVRPLAPYNMADYLRITIGNDEQNESFLTSLRLILK